MALKILNLKKSGVILDLVKFFCFEFMQKIIHVLKNFYMNQCWKLSTEYIKLKCV